jgi:DNA-binding transcriptional LysR family regulator
VRLTEAGRVLLPYAERALESLDQGTAAVRDLVRGTGGRIEIGAAPAVSTYVLPRALQRFASEHPAVALGVRTGHSEELLSLVLAEQVQIAIVRTLRHPEIESTPLYEDEVVLATHPAHAFAGDHAVRVEQLGDQPLILFDPSSSYHELTSAMFRAAGVAPRGVMVLDSIDAAKRMVQLGLGIALLPRSALREELDDGSLAAIAVVSTAPVRRQIVAIRRRDSGDLSPALAALVRCVQDVAAI